MAESTFRLLDTSGSASAAKAAYRTAITGTDAVDLSALPKLPTAGMQHIAVSAQFDNMSNVHTCSTMGASHYAVYVSAISGKIERLDAWTY